MLNNRTTVGLLMEDPGYVNIMVYYNYGEEVRAIGAILSERLHGRRGRGPV